ncbi:hypothetical protein [Pseudoduganella albidiflava]|uniref:DUF697 domain-containing protein n=1 Tax=Pseudoduganella albidiflava TaxID=321983 RepID=A0AA88BYZ0_9BURK|nr:hypothetical protein [Pseudoduganella albidiflava]GGY25846.1 hypothetical protein GCM10007387_04560 [Pseudoduganella albidiflava]
MDSGWELLPYSSDNIAEVRERCRRLVRRRAALAAGVSAVPIPGVDIVSDVKLFTQLIEEVNAAFGLTAAQVERLQPKYRMIAYEASVSVGGMLVGKLITRDLVFKLLAKSGKKLVAKQASKIVPLAGQVASAAIGFFAFRQIGYQHVDACAKVVEELLAAKNR